MLEILIRIYGNRFLMNNIKVKLSLKKKSFSNRRDSDLYLLSQFQYWQVFVGVGVIIWFNILYAFHISFYILFKNLILEPKNF